VADSSQPIFLTCRINRQGSPTKRDARQQKSDMQTWSSTFFIIPRLHQIFGRDAATAGQIDADMIVSIS
jgi:hypothetical protein